MPIVSESRSPYFSTRRLFLDFHHFPALLRMHHIISAVVDWNPVSSLVSHRANAFRSQEQAVAQSRCEQEWDCLNEEELSSLLNAVLKEHSSNK